MTLGRWTFLHRRLMELRPVVIMTVEDEETGEEENGLLLMDFRIIVDEDGGRTIVRPITEEEYDEILATMTHSVKKQSDAN